MRIKLLLFTLLCSLAAIMPAKAETLTVYDGTATNDYVPIYGLYVDEFLKCEFIIPASELAEMKDGTITGLTWYLSRTAAASWGNANFQVFVKEVDFSSFSSNAFSGTNGATTVYQGSLDGTQSTMTINFTTPYSYGGGNLLVGVYNTVKGTWKSASFYGQTVSDACVQGYNASSLSSVSATQRNFIPKTTFTYTPGVVPNPKPTNLAVSDITAHSAKASWTGNDDAQSYNLRYRKAAGVTKYLEESFETFPGSWTIVDSDGDGNNWTQFNPMNFSEGGFTAYDGQYGAMSRSWLNSGALTPDNWLISPQVDLGGVLKYYIVDDGSYQETYRIYVSTTGTNIADFQPITDDLLSPASNTWTERTADLTAFEGQRGYIAFRQYNCTDQDFMIIDAVSIEKANDAGEWTTISPATSPQDITGLDPETEYEVQVQAVYADGSSDWTNSVNFTTTDGLDVPTNLAISEITHNSAVATWEGTQDSYNLRYRTPAKADVNFFEGFENGLDAWTLVNTDGDSYNWQLVDPQTAFSNSTLPRFEGTYCVMSRSYAGSALNPDQWMISPEIEDLGGMLRYYVMDDGANYQETYRIYVSTGSTDIADFVPLTDDMLTPNSAAWTEQAVDLSAYAGQSGRIAFRHYNCTDQDFMFIDAIGIYANEVPAGEWVTVNNVTSPYTIEGLDPETEYEVQVQGIFGENTTNWTESELFTTLEKRSTLAEIEGAGVNGKYTVSDQLVAVDYRQVGDNDFYLWCKDLNHSINPTYINETTQIDFMIQDGAQSGAWDQSNWVILKLTGTAGEGLAASAKGSYIEAGTITGTYDASMNMINVEGTFTVGNSATYDKNVYCTSNFVESNLGQPGAQTGQNDQYYFFMNPKNQEVCHITYAMWDGEKFTVPANSGFAGELAIDYSYNTNAAGTPVTEPTLKKDEVYEFDAFVGRSMSKAGGYIVYPGNLTGEDNIVTAINTVNVNGEVVGVEYVNSLGVVSKRPFSGMNIVVTRYSNGSSTSVKKVFK